GGEGGKEEESGKRGQQRDDDAGEQVVAEERTSEPADKSRIEGIEGGRRARCGVVAVLRDTEEEHAVPAGPDVRDPAQVAGDGGVVPARDIRMVVRLEPREREEGRGPDRGPGPEEELGHRVPGPFEAQLPARGAALLHTFGRAHRRSDDTGLPDRIFTVPEAQATLADVRPLAERMVAARRELTEAGAKLEEL